MTEPVHMTAERLARYDARGRRTELVRGRLVFREPAALWHGVIVARLSFELQSYLRANPIGTVAAGDPGFVLARAPDTVRAPDVAFIAAHRMPPPGNPGFDELAPDLAIEVRSPGDRIGTLRTKVRQWLRAGTRLVWVIDPGRALAHAYRADGSEQVFAATEALEGEDVLPGFSLPLHHLLAR
ncbi:MAG: Uma2 family endonuclease [Gemmatimonadaceae bacterium]|nr:Uma2 family endonuclease [Gemmatimonadaceae bacterium]